MSKPVTFKAIQLAMMLLAVIAVEPVAARDLLLSWNRSTDPNVVGYVLYYGTSSQSYSTRLPVGNVISTSLSLNTAA